MLCPESDKQSFTFIWKLENASYCSEKKDEIIKSAAFVVDAIDETKWRLGLYPRGQDNGSYVGLYLFREPDSKGPNTVDIKYELAFIAQDGSVLKSSSVFEHAFPKEVGIGFHRFEKRGEMFIAKRSAFLPRDILTARCRIWKSFREMPQEIRCFARTCIGVEKRSFVWNIVNFSTVESEKKYSYQIKSLGSDSVLMTVEFFVTGGLGCEEIIGFKLFPEDHIVKFCTMRLYLVDAAGKKVKCNQDEFWFDSIAESKQFSFCFTKQKLIAKRSYLPDDVLSLHWEWAFSRGVVWEEIEEVQVNRCDRSPASDAQAEKTVPLSHTLHHTLKSMYDERFLSDVNLKTSTSIFPAHKIILSASSCVFKAMFSNAMAEKDSDCVVIEDLNDDAISRMLLFIYTAHVDDLTWKSASHLYAAADKYAILSLRKICTSFLKDNLSLTNACEVLLLADLHADRDLKSAVQDFILKHDEDIVKSDEWQLLMETNVNIAVETLCHRYK